MNDFTFSPVLSADWEWLHLQISCSINDASVNANTPNKSRLCLDAEFSQITNFLTGSSCRNSTVYSPLVWEWKYTTQTWLCELIAKESNGYTANLYFCIRGVDKNAILIRWTMFLYQLERFMFIRSRPPPLINTRVTSKRPLHRMHQKKKLLALCSGNSSINLLSLLTNHTVWLIVTYF